MKLDIDRLCLNCMNFAVVNGRCGVCHAKAGTLKNSAMSLTPGTILDGRYLLGRVIGHGGFGITYIGLDLEWGNRVAVKEYMPVNEVSRHPGQLHPVPRHREDFEYGLNRFYDEARTVYQYREHPNIIHVYKLFRENGTAYYVMEYLEGQDMRKLMKRSGGKLEFQTLLPLILPVMDALERVHKDHVIHRDISPDNIFVGNTVKLIDFGAARVAYGNQNKSLSIVLKRGFAPEEQYRTHGRQGPWTDVYALSATMYNALTGKMLPDALDRTRDDRLKDIGALCPGIPAHSAEAIMKGLAVYAKDRYAGIREFRCGLLGEPVSEIHSQSSIEVFRLFGVKGFYAGLSLTVEESITLGREGRECQLVFPQNAKGISRLHCMIFILPERKMVMLQDMNSSWGTSINEKKLPRGGAVQLRNKDRILIGDGQIFEIEF